MRRRLTIVALAVLLLVGAAIGLAAWTPGGSQVRAATAASAPLTPTAKQTLIGAYIDNILEVDPASNSFHADVYIWLRWTNPKLEPWKSLEFVNLYEAWKLMSWTSYDEPVSQPDGSLYYMTRYQGAFNSVQSLHRYPFGTQQLKIEIEDLRDEANGMRYVTDGPSVAIAPDISVPGYTIGQPTIVAADHAYATDFGFLEKANGTVYSRATITVPISHPILTNVFKFLVPIVLVMIAAGLIFQIPPNLVEGRIGLAITALLTLVAMEWTSTDRLPINSYLTLLDALYLLSLTFVLGSLVQAIRISWVARDKTEAEAIRQDERSMKVFFGAYALAFAATLILFLLT